MPSLFRCTLLAAVFATLVPAAEPPIKVGEYASLTGKEATYGQASHRGTVLAIEEINARGGVLGRQLELVVEDTQSKPGESATVVKKLISRDKVVAILGEIASGRSLEAAPICQNARIPMISPGSTTPQLTARRNYIFRACFIDSFQGTVMAKFAEHTLKARRVAMLTSATSAESVGLAKYFREEFTRSGGTIVLEQKFSDGDKDFRAQLTAIRAAEVDGIFVPAYYAEAGLICKQARELGIRVPLFGIDGWESPELVRLAGDAVEGCYFVTHFSPENNASAVVSFNERYRKRWGLESDALAALGYDSVLMLVDAIERAGSAEPARIRDALARTKNLHGATGTITLDADRNPTKSAVILQVRDGRFHFVESIEP